MTGRKKCRMSIVTALMLIVLGVIFMAMPVIAQNGGTVGLTHRSDSPTVTYNVSGLNLGDVTKQVDGEAENFHFYEKGEFEPGEVIFWGTITNNSSGGSLFYRVNISYRDSEGNIKEVIKNEGENIEPKAVADYRFTAVIPDSASHVHVDISAIAWFNAYVRGTMKGDFYRPVKAPAAGEKTLGTNIRDGIVTQNVPPTITYNVKGINLGAIKDEIDGESSNKHYYDQGEYEPGIVEVWGTVRNNAVAGQNAFYKAVLKYTGSDGKERKEETEYIYVGAGYTKDYRISASIPADTKNAYMEVSAVGSWNAYIRSTVSANLYPVAKIQPAPTPTPTPAPVPAVPTANNAEVFESGARLMWQPYSGCLGYRLYRSTNQNQLGISVTDFYITSTSYADVNVESKTTYHYTVKPVLAEANPYQGIEEKLGPAIATWTVTTGSQIYKPGSYKHFIMMKLESPMLSVDGIEQEIDPGRGTAPIIITGRTMVPIRAVVEAMGGEVGWDQGSQKITLKARGNLVEMWMNKTDITINGAAKKMDVAPVAKDGRTFVPVRFAAENLNCKVDWINSTKEAVIVYEE